MNGFKPILLASGSPRRKQLLEEAGFQFRVQVTNIEENYPDTLPLDEIAGFLAEKKANAALTMRKSEEVILASDSVVVCNDKLYEKPKDKEDAYRMLNELSGKAHYVYTGICLKNDKQTHTTTGAAQVFFDELSQEEIKYYVDHFLPLDKAGSYGIQEWLGHCKIKEIRGTYPTIMGLPVHLVYDLMNRFFRVNS